MATWHTMAPYIIALHSIAEYIIPDQHRHPETRTIHPWGAHRSPVVDIGRQGAPLGHVGHSLDHWAALP
eukprot:2436653-Pyramimonas_sp.AAC.1